MSRELRARRDLGRILDDTFAFHRRHWRTLLPATAAVALPVQLGVLGVGLGWLWSDYDATRSFGELVTAAATQYLLLTPLVTAIVIYVAVESDAGRSPRAGPALTYSLEAFRVVFPAMVLVGLGITVGFLIAVFLLVRWAVVPQVAILEGRRGTDALRASWNLVRGRGWWTFAVVLVANLLVGALSAISTVPGGLLAKQADLQVIELAGVIVGQVVTLPLAAIATTFLYFSLVAGPGQPAPQAPAVPAAPEPEPPEPEPPSPPPDPWEQRRREGWEPPGSG